MGTNNSDNNRLRFNILTVLVYLVGIILVVQLFNLQIVQGEEYRNESNTKLTRETVLEAARGSILDRTGNTLAGTTMGFSLELYKTKVDTDTLYASILNMVNVLEANGDRYVDSFPISINPFGFNFSDEASLQKWKQNNKIDEAASAEECFYFFKNKYKINNDSIEETRKIIAIVYEIKTKGYSTTKSIEVASNISSASVQVFEERSNDFPGLAVVKVPIRNYTKGNLASHIIGYIGKIDEKTYKEKKDTYARDDYIGKSGIESVFEDYLRGEDGTGQIDMDVDGSQTGEYISKEAVAGSDVVLTIDSNLQAVAETALKNNIEKIRNGGFSQRYDAKGGSVVVTNVKTGEILALANYPDYSPSIMYNGLTTTQWSEYRENQALYNRAISGSWAPGSTFKMVTAIAALETGVVTRTERINDTGVYPLWHNPVCWYWTEYHRGHGPVNVSDAIKKSCNFYFYEVGRRMGIDNLAKYARYFGLGEKTGIELPSETSGELASRENSEAKGEKWQTGNILSAVIGQSDNDFSPLQMARYISILANGGNRIDLTIVKSILRADGTEVSKTEIEEFVDNKLGVTQTNAEDLQINPDNLKEVLEGMRSVAMEAGGTAHNIFRNFNIEVGGKTGTAETATSDVTAWFTGFAPFDDPEIAVVVMVENGGHGNYTAEVVRDIIAEYFGMNSNTVEEEASAIPYTEEIR